MIYNFNNISPKIDKDSWYAPNSVLIGNVTLKKDANIWFNATLRGDVEPITIGEGSNIQDGSVVHTDPGCPTIIGKNVTVGHLVMLHGCIIEDDCFIGALSEIVEGVIVRKGSVVSMGCYIGRSTKIINRETGDIISGEVPAGSVVVPGTLPSKKPGGPNLYCVVIIKTVDEKTRSKTSLNDLLRD